MEINEYTDRKIDKYREREGNNEIHRVCVRDRERFRHWDTDQTERDRDRDNQRVWKDLLSDFY